VIDDYRSGPGIRTGQSVKDRPLVTELLLAVNVLLWLALEVSGGSTDPEVLLDFGAMSAPRIADGDYWRLFTAMFLHAGATHILFNGLALFIFGRMVEGIFGHSRFAIVYLLAGLFGSVASFTLNSTGVGAGASGAIFGVIGALAAYFVTNREVLGTMGRQNLTGLLVLAGINLLFGFSVPGIDNWAHIGGLGSGFLLGMTLAPSYHYVTPIGPFQIPGSRRIDANSLARRWYVVPVALAFLFGSLGIGLASQPETARSHVLKAERHLETGDYEGAFFEVTEALNIDRSYGEAFLVEGRAHAELGNIDLAKTALGQAFIFARTEKSRNEARSLFVSLSSGR
jgi:rhomboid protease GluP